MAIASTTALVAAASAGTALQFLSMGAQANAALAAGKVNAQNAEFNAELVKKQAIDAAQRFRVSARKDQARQVASISAAGVRLEGSALDVLQENARLAEEDAQNIEMQGLEERNAYLRQASYYRLGGQQAARAAGLGAAANLLSGGAQVYGQYNRLKGGEE